MSRLIEASIAEERIKNLLNLLDEVCKNIRETHGDDSVCGLCEYDGDAFIAELGEWVNECPGFDKDDCFCMKENIKKKYTEPIPTVDAVPIRTGKWKLHVNGSGTCNQCSVTQRGVWDYDNWQNFCGHCGARMIGGGNERD